MSYKFCKPFEDSVDREYVMRLDNNGLCGQTLNELDVFVCSTHIKENMDETNRLKAIHTRALINLGVPEENMLDDYLEELEV